MPRRDARAALPGRLSGPPRSTSEATPPVRGCGSGDSDVANGSGGEAVLGRRPPRPSPRTCQPSRVSVMYAPQRSPCKVHASRRPHIHAPSSSVQRASPLTAVEQHGGAHRGAAPQIVRDDTAQLGEQGVAEHPSVGRGAATAERGAGTQPFVGIEYGHDRGRRLGAVPRVEPADDLPRIAQQGDSGGGPFRRFEQASGGCGGRGQGCRRGRSESEGHVPPFGYAPTLRAGSDSRSAHRSGTLPEHGVAVRGADFNSSCRTWMRQRAIETGDRYQVVCVLYPYPKHGRVTHGR